VSTYPQRDVAHGTMGKASSFALGLALAQPDTKVIVLDGDGSLEMNLGTLVTIADKGPGNFYHFVLENGMYATTGGQPIPGKDVVSFSGLAQSAGYAAVYDFDNLEDLATQTENILSQPGPVLVCVKTTPNPRLRGQRGEETAQGRRPIRQAISETRRDLGVA
jgi:phosphonopyruvate decarboxylase